MQNDEAWWQAAWQDGLSTVGTAFDSAGHSQVDVAAVIKDGSSRLGVVSLSFNSTPFVTALERAGDGIRVDVIDSTNRIVLSSDSPTLGHYLTGIGTNRGDAQSNEVFEVGAERASATRTNHGRWRVVAHQSSNALNAPFRSTRVGLASLVAALARRPAHRPGRRPSVPGAPDLATGHRAGSRRGSGGRRETSRYRSATYRPTTRSAASDARSPR